VLAHGQGAPDALWLGAACLFGGMLALVLVCLAAWIFDREDR